MIVPSIDLLDGKAVQLVGGDPDRLEVDAGDPLAVAERFAVAGTLAVIDLDAALGRGSNRDAVLELVRRYPCNVGGGVRSADAALELLDAGAERVILGTAATPDVLAELPRDRVLAALDAVHDEVVVEGWTSKTGVTVLDRMAELRPLVAGFLVTFVEHEGSMSGVDPDRVRTLVRAARGETSAPSHGDADGDHAAYEHETSRDCRVIIAGGVRHADEVGMIDRLGADAQVGMGLYTGRIDLGDALAAPLRTDRTDGLWPTVVCDEHGSALGLAYSNEQSVREAVRTRRGVYWSRSRGGLWRKGESSGDQQHLVRIDADCDRDTLRFTVRQRGAGFCHEGTRTCFGDHGVGVARLARTVSERARTAPPGSYTRRLFDDAELLGSKLHEEANELLDATTADEAAWEAADVIYFALVAAARRGADLRMIEAELDRRTKRVRRRKGDAKT